LNKFIIMPVYNESLQDIVTELYKWASCDIKGVVIVWKGRVSSMVTSTINTLSPIHPIVVREQRIDKYPGLAGAYEQGLVEIRQIYTFIQDDDYIITIDCGSWNPLDLMYAFAVTSVSQAYLGVRRKEYVRDLKFRVRNTYRRWLSLVGSWLIARKSGVSPSVDYTCGYRMYSVKLLKQLNISGKDVPNRLYHAKLAVNILRYYRGDTDHNWEMFECDPQSDDTKTALNLTDAFKSLYYVLKGKLGE
jgi:hypothetical protein